MEAIKAITAIFENNLVNWLILVGLIVYYWNKKTPALFDARKQRIETAIADAAAAKAEGEAFLKQQQATVANIEQDSARIIAEAKQVAAEMQAQMDQQTQKDIADLLKKIESQIASERQLAITELRAAAARASIKLTEQVLPSLMTGEAKSKLLSQFMEQLDSGSGQAPMLSRTRQESIH
jgi:F-type H+-transporting ATPase subunit b